MSLTDAERADFYLKLAIQARDRFKARQDVEWKTSIGLWSVFGLGGVGILTARFWPHGTPAAAIAVVGAVMAGVILIVYCRHWQPYMAECMRRDTLTGYFWESCVQQLLNISLPPFLDPGVKSPTGDAGTTEWVTLQQVAARLTGSTSQPLPDTIKSQKHKSQVCQLLMTVAFASFFVGALWVQCSASDARAAEEAKSKAAASK